MGKLQSTVAIEANNAASLYRDWSKRLLDMGFSNEAVTGALLFVSIELTMHKCSREDTATWLRGVANTIENFTNGE